MSESFTIIHAVINCSRINKARLFRKTDQQGNEKPGQYLKIVLIQKKEKDQYGNTLFMIKEDVSKDERAQGIEGGFIGDGKIYKPKAEPAPAAKPPTQRTRRPGDVPF